MKKYVKVMFNNKSSASDFKYKIGEINIANNFNPKADNPKDMGGFNFSTEDKILRWLIRGDTLYDVIIPKHANVINCYSESSPNGVFRTDKIILTNPRKITDEIAMKLYLKSDLPEKSYYKSLAGIAIMGYANTCKKLIRDKINKNNIDLVLDEINDFVKASDSYIEGNKDVFNEIMNILNKIKFNV